MVMWEKKTIGECAEIISGGTPSTTVPAYWDGGILWCTPTDITKVKSKYLSATERTISDKGLKDSAAILLPVGTILLCSRATIGKMCIAAKPISTNQGFKNLVCGSGSDNNFMYYLLQTKIGAMLELAIGSTFLEISKKALASIEIPLPPHPEQRRIAAALSDTDALITELERLIAKKRAVKKGAMQELLTGKRRLPGFEGEWVDISLDSLCYLLTKQTGFDYSATIKPSLSTEPIHGYIPFIQNKDFEGYRINFNTDFYIPLAVAQTFPQILLDEPCLLISISGRIGNVGYYNNSALAFIGGAVGIARFKNLSHAKWVMIYLQSQEGQEQIFANEKAGAQHNLTIADIRNLSIPMPKDDEQTAIVEILSDMDAEIDKLTARLSKLRGIKQGMMSELLTGRIRLVEQDATTNTENLNAVAGREN